MSKVYQLDVNYPIALSERLGGRFTLKLADDLSCRHNFGRLSMSGGETESSVALGMLMQLDAYFFERAEDAHASFDDAERQLNCWPDSQRGHEYLLKLWADDDIARTHLGKIGSL